MAEKYTLEKISLFCVQRACEMMPLKSKVLCSVSDCVVSLSSFSPTIFGRDGVSVQIVTRNNRISAF